MNTLHVFYQCSSVNPYKTVQFLYLLLESRNAPFRYKQTKKTLLSVTVFRHNCITSSLPRRVRVTARIASRWKEAIHFAH